jgi:cell division protein FtsB
MRGTVLAMAVDPGVLVPSRRHGARFRVGREALRRLLPAAVLALGALGAPTLLVGSGGISRLKTLEAERSKVEGEILRARTRIEELRATAQAVKRDPATLERVARDQLGLVRATEMVVLVEADRR